MSRTSELIALEDRYGAHNYHPLDIVIERGEGAYVFDAEGRRYLDALAAYSAANQGHSHPRILETMIAQAARVTITSRAFRNDQLGPFCRELADLCALDVVLPMNTGAEAVETAIKAARRYGYRKLGIPDGRAEIVVFDDNFHGRTTTIVGFSSDEAYKRDFGPFTPGFVSIRFGDLPSLADAIGPNTCAVLVEPIQAEAGVLVPPDGYLRRASYAASAACSSSPTRFKRVSAARAICLRATARTYVRIFFCSGRRFPAATIRCRLLSAGATCSNSSSRAATGARSAAIRSAARSRAWRYASSSMSNWHSAHGTSVNPSSNACGRSIRRSLWKCVVEDCSLALS